jgi:hypothetical protein
MTTYIATHMLYAAIFNKHVQKSTTLLEQQVKNVSKK